MLEDIVISRVRVKMLGLFLSNPGMIFHVRDIVRRVGEEINAETRTCAYGKSRYGSKEPGQIDFSMYLKRISFIQ